MSLDSVLPLLVEYGTKLLGALALWFIGGAIIDFAVQRIDRATARSSLDATTRSYLLAGLRILGKLAIGMAWSGLLANFAAGVFLAALRPFKVGDMISAGGVTGVVVELGMFATTLTTADNLKVVVGNNKIFADNIINYSANATRRVDLTAQLSGAADLPRVRERLMAAMARIPNVSTTPAPEVAILEFNLVGPVLAVRPHCANEHYWQVYFDTNEMLRSTLAEFPSPQARYAISVDAPIPHVNGITPASDADVVARR